MSHDNRDDMQVAIYEVISTDDSWADAIADAAKTMKATEDGSVKQADLDMLMAGAMNAYGAAVAETADQTIH
jgi:hypothetical protein